MQPHAPLDADHAELLARYALRGRAWQRAGVELFDTSLPLRMSERCLRACALWAVERPVRPARTRWDDAFAPPPAAVTTDEELLRHAAEAAARFAKQDSFGRQMHAAVRHDLQNLGFFQGDSALLDEAVSRALGLRLIDLVGGEPFSADLAHIARYGHPHAAVPNEPYVLHSEKVACCTSMSFREIDLVRRYLFAKAELGELAEHLYGVEPLVLAVITLANMRMSEPPYEDVTVPLTALALDNLQRRVTQLEQDIREADFENADQAGSGDDSSDQKVH